MDTIGELRAYLRDTNASWQVDPSFADSDPIPKYPTGGRPDYPSQSGSSAWDDLRAILSQPRGQERLRCQGPGCSQGSSRG
jgi:hypothetical protein